MKSRRDKHFIDSFWVLTVDRSLLIIDSNVSLGNNLWQTLKKYQEMRSAAIACL